MTPTERLLALWDHLGIGAAHVATQMPGDIAPLAAAFGDAAGRDRAVRADPSRSGFLRRDA